MERTDTRYQERDEAAWITIDRAPVMNAVRTRTLEEIVESVAEADRSPKVASIVLTGAGERSFSTGGDLAELRNSDAASRRRFLGAFAGAFSALRGAQKPVLARVDGWCLGGGNELNLACDLTIASDRSTFGQVGPTVGSAPALGATQILPRLVGEKRAREIIFLCHRYTAKDAQALGWINRVVPAAELDAAVGEWTARLAGMSPQSLRVAKRSLNHAGNALLPSLNHGVELLCGVFATEEFAEGMSAFAEKRKPDFRKFR